MLSYTMMTLNSCKAMMVPRLSLCKALHIFCVTFCNIMESRQHLVLVLLLDATAIYVQKLLLLLHTTLLLLRASKTCNIHTKPHYITIYIQKHVLIHQQLRNGNCLLLTDRSSPFRASDASKEGGLILDNTEASIGI
jgi:hypothetical protein